MGKQKQFFFLQKDLEILKDKIADIEKKHQELISQVSAACSQSSETWHDNPAHEEIMHQDTALQIRIDELKGILDHAVIVEPEKSKEKIGIGSIIKLKCDSEKEKIFRLGSFLIFKNNPFIQ